MGYVNCTLSDRTGSCEFSETIMKSIEEEPVEIAGACGGGLPVGRHMEMSTATLTDRTKSCEFGEPRIKSIGQ